MRALPIDWHIDLVLGGKPFMDRNQCLDESGYYHDDGHNLAEAPDIFTVLD